MKVQLVRANLIGLVTDLALVAKPRTPQPVLSCCLLETFAEGLRGTATDTFQSVVSSAPCTEIVTAGGVAVSARDLLERVKTLPEGPVTLQTDGEKLRISAGKRKHSLSAVTPEEFPVVSTKLTGGLKVPGNLLLDLFRRTRPMAAVDSDRAQLKAVLLEFEAGKITATSTDSHRLSFASEIIADCKAGPPKIVPTEAVEVLMGLLDPEVETEVGMIGYEFAVRIGAVTFSTKLVDGAYPPFRQHFVDAPGQVALVSRKAFIESLASVDKATGGSVVLRLSADGIALRAEGKGDAEDVVDAKYEGREVTVAANARYLIEAMTAIDTTEVRFNVGGDLDPMWFRPDDTESPLEIVMPTRL
jgi:DNA polymerase III subunit beta